MPEGTAGLMSSSVVHVSGGVSASGSRKIDARGRRGSRADSCAEEQGGHCPREREHDDAPGARPLRRRTPSLKHRARDGQRVRDRPLAPLELRELHGEDRFLDSKGVGLVAVRHAGRGDGRTTGGKSHVTWSLRRRARCLTHLSLQQLRAPTPPFAPSGPWEGSPTSSLLLCTVRRPVRDPVDAVRDRRRRSAEVTQPRSAALSARTASGMSRGRVEPKPSTRPAVFLRPS